MTFTDNQVYGVLLTEKAYWEQEKRSAKYKRDWRRSMQAAAGLHACNSLLKRFEQIAEG